MNIGSCYNMICKAINIDITTPNTPVATINGFIHIVVIQEKVTNCNFNPNLIITFNH